MSIDSGFNFLAEFLLRTDMKKSILGKYHFSNNSMYNQQFKYCH